MGSCCCSIGKPIGYIYYSWFGEAVVKGFDSVLCRRKDDVKLGSWREVIKLIVIISSMDQKL